MTKVAIISDSHYGVRGDNIHFLDMTKSFLDNVFFPTLEEQKIQTIIHLGDLVDKRKSISYLTAKRLREDFLTPLELYTSHFIVGNHDCQFKNTNDVNALTELLGTDNPSISIYTKAKEIQVGGYKILLIPWICDDNREHSMKLIQNTTAQLCMGHLEIQGFEMYKGSVATHGESRTTFDKFDMTLSGHYHHRSSDGCITYVGSHGEFTWSDYDDPRGFHILDLNTRELTFYKNPYTMFTKLWYSDLEKQLEDLLDLDSSVVTGKYIKLIVTNKTNPYWFDIYCSKLEKMDPISIQIVEDHLNLNLDDAEDIVDEAESTIDIFRKHIDQIEGNVNKLKLELLMTDLYTQALTVD